MIQLIRGPALLFVSDDFRLSNTVSLLLVALFLLSSLIWLFDISCSLSPSPYPFSGPATRRRKGAMVSLSYSLFFDLSFLLLLAATTAALDSGKRKDCGITSSLKADPVSS